VLVVATGLLAAIPWMAAFPLASLGGHHGDSWLRAMLDEPRALYVFILVVLAVGLANFGGTLFRSRSPWVALDFVLLLAAFWAIRRYVAPLWWYGVFVGTGAWTPLSASRLALAVLGARPRSRRADGHWARPPRPVRRLWAVVGLTLATAAGYRAGPVGRAG
jgi:hypothetical protein